MLNNTLTTTGEFIAMKPAGNRIVAIAGASSGAGRAMAERLGSQGYAVALAARRGELIEQIADGIRRGGGKALAVPADLGVWAEAEAFVQKTAAEFGRIDVLVNNAGWGIRLADFDDLSIEEIDQGVAVNLMAVLYACRAALPVMKGQKSGHIINVSSILGKRSRAKLAVYTACKHAVEGFSRSLLNDANRFGIKVSVLAPAAIRTEWAAKAGGSLPEKIRLLAAEDVARMIQTLIETEDHYTVWNMDLIALEQSIEPL
jgi:3-oxoacyl-[acyl-carrier protein] reductase